MSPITRIALRKIKRNWRQSVFLIIAILFSMLMISFLLFFEWQTRAAQHSSYHELPFTSFLYNVQLCMRITVAFLIFITCLIVRTYAGLRSDEHAQLLAVLTSVGAVGRQKRRLLTTEIILLYLPPTALGVGLGMLPGITMGNLFLGNPSETGQGDWTCVALAVGIVIVGMLLISLCYRLPDLKLKKRAVMQAVKKQNVNASEERHGYRQSKTFQSQILLARLAKKSVDYYQKAYRGIARSFASSALYPVLAILLFWQIGKPDVVLDDNPYDLIDTASAVLEAVDGIVLFLGSCFLVLTCVGILQAALMVRMQWMTRRESARIYLSLGMPDSDIRKMIRLELRSVLLRAFLYFLFATLIAAACYTMLAG